MLAVQAELHAVDQRTAQCELVGIFEVVAHGDALGQCTDEYLVAAGEFLEDVISRGVALDGGPEGEDDFLNGAI